MTFPRAERDLLMFLASSKTVPSAPVLLTYIEMKGGNEMVHDDAYILLALHTFVNLNSTGKCVKILVRYLHQI